ncbi:unnamed protein product [Phytophthora fragariaefolia]|uniref:Unnamed protein product n=1 Tax=Phytophthora fragariaefolia TaxID=1490495 RepID=A0A9W7D4M5_9STRA|nr:unnamed protein product [Phytophthora fragariaefolia]
MFLSATQNTILYVLNDRHSPQWCYDYSSGSARKKREMKHVLAAYVFVLHEHPAHQGQVNPQFDGMSVRARKDRSPVAWMATVIARVTSPEFKLVSYRRQPGLNVDSSTFGNNPSTYDSSGGSGWHDDDESSSKIDRKTRRAWAIRTMGSDSPNVMAQIPGMSITNPMVRSQLCHEPHTTHSSALHRGTMNTIRPLFVLQHFFRVVPLDAFAFYIDQMDFRIRHRWLAKITPKDPRQPGAVANSLVAEMASTFSLASFLPGHSKSARRQRPATITSATKAYSESSDPTLRSHMVLQACADLLLDTFSSGRVRQILAAALATPVASGEVGLSGQSDACAHFCQLVRDLSDEFSHLLIARSRSNNTFGIRTAGSARSTDECSSRHPVDTLAGEILSLVLSDANSGLLREAVLGECYRDEASLILAAQGLLWAFADLQQQLYNVRCHRLSSARHPDGQNPANSIWSRRWFLLPKLFSVSSIPTESNQNTNSATSESLPYCELCPSLLTVLGLVRMLASVDVELTGLEFSFDAATDNAGLRSPMVSRTKFLLDGCVHSFTSVTNGTALGVRSTTFGGSWSLTAYKGRLGNDGSSIELLLFVLPRSPSKLLAQKSQLIEPMENLRVNHLHIMVTLNDVLSDEYVYLSVVANLAIIQQRFSQRNMGLDDELIEHNIGIMQNLHDGRVPALEVRASYAAVASAIH